MPSTLSTHLFSLLPSYLLSYLSFHFVHSIAAQSSRAFEHEVAVWHGRHNAAKGKKDGKGGFTDTEGAGLDARGAARICDFDMTVRGPLEDSTMGWTGRSDDAIWMGEEGDRFVGQARLGKEEVKMGGWAVEVAFEACAGSSGLGGG